MQVAMAKHRDPSQVGLGPFVRAHLDGKKIQHNALGEWVGWSKQKTYRFLQGDYDANMTELTRVARFMDCPTIEDLLARATSPVTAPAHPHDPEEAAMLSTDEQWVLHSFRRMTPAQRQRALRTFLALLSEADQEPHTTNDHTRRLRHAGRR